jgi:hypothetical protein
MRNRQNCPNCGAKNVAILDQRGRLAPFVAWRFFGVRSDSYLPCDSLYCPACHFLAPAADIPDVLVNDYYADYMQPSYWSDRLQFEPGLAPIVGKLSVDPAEIEARQRQMTAFLGAHIDPATIVSVLDYGGGSGACIPRLFSDAQKCVYDVNDTPLAPGVYHWETWHNDFSFVQISQVLEHVMDPHDLVRDAISLTDERAWIYLDVPLEQPEEVIDQIVAGAEAHYMHEHLNQYTPSAVRALMESCGMFDIVMTEYHFDIGWYFPSRWCAALGRVD